MLSLDRHDEVFVAQRKELAEMFGFESRNKYAIEAGSEAIGYAAEQGRGFWSTLGRWFVGHWREFEIQAFDPARNPWFRAHHPFRFLLQRLDVYGANGSTIGAIEQRFTLLTKRFDVTDARGAVLFTVDSPLWHPWTFTFHRGGEEAAVVQKRWSGALTEVFTDADRFRVGFGPAVRGDERVLVIAAALFIDLVYFERKARR